MPNHISLLTLPAIMAVAMLTCASASAMAEQGQLGEQFVCTHKSQQRVISVVYLTPGKLLPCEVRYQKPEGNSVPWRSQSLAGFCERKASELAASQVGWGWDCQVSQLDVQTQSMASNEISTPLVAATPTLATEPTLAATPVVQVVQATALPTLQAGAPVIEPSVSTLPVPANTAVTIVLAVAELETVAAIETMPDTPLPSAPPVQVVDQAQEVKPAQAPLSVQSQYQQQNAVLQAMSAASPIKLYSQNFHRQQGLFPTDLTQIASGGGWHSSEHYQSLRLGEDGSIWIVANEVQQQSTIIKLTPSIALDGMLINWQCSVSLAIDDLSRCQLNSALIGQY